MSYEIFRPKPGFSIGVGITSELNRSVGPGFQQTFDLTSQLRHNLIHLISTEKGERFMLPNFGVNKRKWLFELFTNESEDIDSYIIDEIRQAVKIWLPEIKILNMTTNKQVDENYVDLNLDFIINDNINDVQTLQIPISES